MARVFLLAGAVAAVVSVADAHTAMVLPKPSYPQGFYQGMNPVMRIQSSKFGAGIPGYQGMAKITEAMKGQSSLKAFIMANAVLTGTGHATKECGWALANGEPQPVPAALDFPWGHPGPCEVWCDNTKVFYNENCMGNSVGKVPLGGKCDGAKMLQAMYIGTHVENWEVYMQCAPLGGGGGGAGTGGGGGAGTGGNTPAGGNGNGNGNNSNNNGNTNNNQNNNNNGNGNNSNGNNGNNNNNGNGNNNNNGNNGNGNNNNSNGNNNNGNNNNNNNNGNNNNNNGNNNGNNNNNNGNAQNNRNNNNGNRNNGQPNNNGQRSADPHSFGFDSVFKGKRQLRA